MMEKYKIDHLVSKGHTKKFYLFYEDIMETLQQVVADSKENILQQVAAKLFSLPWGHHLLLMDKFTNQPEKAWFYICQSVNDIRASTRQIAENIGIGIVCIIIGPHLCH